MSQPDCRPVVFAGVEFGESLRRPDNPHGYNDNNGTTTWRRLDKPECIPGWQDVIARAKAFGCQGIMWWQVSGFLPGRPQYVVEPHLIPPDVLPQFREIIKLAGQAGLWTGCLLRPADLSLRTSWDEEVTFPFAQLTGDVEKLLIDRTDAMAQIGADGAHYLDSFGLGDLDATTAKWLRSVVGPDVPLYVEQPSDRTLPYAGGFQVVQGGQFLQTGAAFDVLRWLFPDARWLMLDTDFGPVPERVRFAQAQGMAALVLGEELPTVARSTPTERWLDFDPADETSKQVVREVYERKHAAMAARMNPNPEGV